MRRLFAGYRRKLAVVAVLLAVMAGLLWWQREPLLSWYYLRGLAGAGEADRGVWVDRVASLDAAAVPGLIELLGSGDVKSCANAEAALAAVARRWGPTDPRTAALAEEITGAFASLGTPGREAALEWHLALLRDQKAGAGPLTAAACTLLQTAAKMPEKGVRLRTLALAEMLLGRAAPVKADLCRELALQGMTARESDLRAAGIRLTMHLPLHADKTLLDRVVPLLKDPSPEVRCAAVLAVGLAEETITVQEMLPLLHDADADVRRLCESALRSRGLGDLDVKRAQAISHPHPGERLKVVHLLDADDLEAGIGMWLTYMSQDPSPAVRAAALRFAGEDPGAVDFHDRMLQMAREDPSPTVRQLALFYARLALQRKQ